MPCPLHIAYGASGLIRPLQRVSAMSWEAHRWHISRVNVVKRGLNCCSIRPINTLANQKKTNNATRYARRQEEMSHKNWNTDNERRTWRLRRQSAPGR